MSQVIIRKESISGFTTGPTINTFYHQKRYFKPNSTLYTYLKKKYPACMHKDTYSLFEILIILERIIRTEKQFDENNPCMILCNQQLQEALKVRAVLCSSVQYYVLRQMSNEPNNTTDLTKYLAPRQNKEDNGYWVIHAPVWANKHALAIQIELRQRKSIQTGTVWRINEDLRQLLIKEKYISEYQHLFDYQDLVKTVSTIMTEHSMNTNDENNKSAIIIQNTPLEAIFGVKALDSTQYLSFIQYQLIEQIEDNSIADYIQNTIEQQRHRDQIQQLNISKSKHIDSAKDALAKYFTNPKRKTNYIPKPVRQKKPRKPNMRITKHKPNEAFKNAPTFNNKTVEQILRQIEEEINPLKQG